MRHIIAPSNAGGLLYTWLQDFRYAWRMFRKNVLSSVVILAPLAIGIGANTAIFSVVDTLLLRRLPYPHAERMAAVWLHSSALAIYRDWPSPGQFIDIQQQNHSFDQMALAQSRAHTLAGREQAELIAGVRAQSSLLEMLGAKPVLGRLLLPEDDKPGNPNVVILTDRIWKRLFNSDPAIVGKSSAIVCEIHSADSSLAVYGIRTMQERVYDSLACQRFASTMLGAFAAFAMLLSGYGPLQRYVLPGNAEHT